MNAYTVLVKIMDAVIVLGIKAETESVARDLATEYFDKLGYDDAKIISVRSGISSVEELSKIPELIEAIPPSVFESQIEKLRSMLGDSETLPSYREDYQEVQRINNEIDKAEDPLPPYILSEHDKLFLHKYGIATT